MLATPLLGERARAKIFEYIAEKRAGHYGTSKLSLRKFKSTLGSLPDLGQGSELITDFS